MVDIGAIVGWGSLILVIIVILYLVFNTRKSITTEHLIKEAQKIADRAEGKSKKIRQKASNQITEIANTHYKLYGNDFQTQMKFHANKEAVTRR